MNYLVIDLGRWQIMDIISGYTDLGFHSAYCYLWQ